MAKKELSQKEDTGIFEEEKFRGLDLDLDLQLYLPLVLTNSK